jgi:hypothetical protein
MSDPDEEEATFPVTERSIFYSAVGQAISLWAAMEGTLVEIAAKLFDTTDRKTGLILYSITNFHSWLNIIDELFLLEVKYNSHKPDWGLASARLRSLNDIRVRLAHHTVWGGPSQEPGGSALRPNRYDTRAKSRKHAPLQAQEILAFIDGVLEMEDDLETLIAAMKVTATPPSSPLRGKPFEPKSGRRTPKGAQ